MIADKILVNEGFELPLQFVSSDKDPQAQIIEFDPVDVSDISPLTKQEKDSLDKYEKIIKKGKGAFVEVGAALTEIKAGKLYHSKYKTFTEYCEKEWQFSRVHANRLINSCKVVEALKKEPIGTVFIPETESQARHLADLQADKLTEVAKKMGPGKATAKEVDAAKAEVVPSKKKEKKPMVLSDDQCKKTKITLTEVPKKDMATLMEALDWTRELVEKGADKEETLEQIDESIEIVQYFINQLTTPDLETV